MKPGHSRKLTITRLFEHMLEDWKRQNLEVLGKGIRNGRQKGDKKTETK